MTSHLEFKPVEQSLSQICRDPYSRKWTKGLCVGCRQSVDSLKLYSKLGIYVDFWDAIIKSIKRVWSKRDYEPLLSTD